jgi:hypothetical protein
MNKGILRLDVEPEEEPAYYAHPLANYAAWVGHPADIAHQLGLPLRALVHIHRGNELLH